MKWLGKNARDEATTRRASALADAHADALRAGDAAAAADLLERLRALTRLGHSNEDQRSQLAMADPEVQNALTLTLRNRRIGLGAFGRSE